jgi:hypothetical protein
MILIRTGGLELQRLTIEREMAIDRDSHRMTDQTADASSAVRSSSAEDVLAAFCLGDVPLNIEKTDGSVIKGRMIGLKTEEYIGSRDRAATSADWIVSIAPDHGGPFQIRLSKIRSIGRPAG